MPLTSPSKFKTDGAGNSYGGFGTGVNFLTGSADNTLVGNLAGAGITTATKNTLIGSLAAQALTTALKQTVVGYRNLSIKTSYQDLLGTVVVGSDNALAVTTAGSFIVIGVNNLSVWNGTSESRSVMIGFNIMGTQAGATPPTSGTPPAIAIGTNFAALMGGGAGGYTNDIMLGTSVGMNYQGNNNGVSPGPNIAIGLSALLCQNFATRTPGNCIAIGELSLAGATTAYDVVGIGRSAATQVTTANQSVFVGVLCGQRVTTGNNNAWYGYRAGDALGWDNKNNSVLLGNLAGVGITPASSKLVIDNSGSTLPLIAGDFGTVNVANGFVAINGHLAPLYQAIAASNGVGTSLSGNILGCSAVNITITVSTADIAQKRAFVIKDETGTASGVNTITITPQSGAIDGVASKQIIVPYGSLSIYSNGTNLFTY